MTHKIRSISQFVVPFQSALFSCGLTIVANSKGAAIRSAQCAEEFAPRRCFVTPKRVKILHRIVK